VRHLLLLIIST